MFDDATFELFYDASAFHAQPDLLGSLRYKACGLKRKHEEEFTQLNEQLWGPQILHCQRILASLVDKEELAKKL